MENFEFYKKIRFSDIVVKKAIPRLEKLYRKIPETKGCFENLEKCKSWCCFFQTSQLFYVEFLYIWGYIIKEWDADKIADLLKAAMRNYVAGLTTKGCILFDKKTKLCSVHLRRPLNCFFYGITPKEEFEPRYKRMKEMYKDVIGAVIRDQCDLVSTCNGKKIKTDDTNRWFEELKKIENLIGIKKENINDDMGGSYRTFHDHLLLYLMPDNVLEDLQILRFSDNEEEKIAAIEQFIFNFRKLLKK